MPVTYAVIGLEPGHYFHVFHSIARLEQVQPMRDGLTVLFSMDGKYDAGPLGFPGLIMGRVFMFANGM